MPVEGHIISAGTPTQAQCLPKHILLACYLPRGNSESEYQLPDSETILGTGALGNFIFPTFGTARFLFCVGNQLLHVVHSERVYVPPNLYQNDCSMFCHCTFFSFFPLSLVGKFDLFQSQSFLEQIFAVFGMGGWGGGG